MGAWIVHRIMLPSSAGIKSEGPNLNTPGVALPKLPNRLSAGVISVTDGDTIVVADSAGSQESVRLAGIDAPEHDQSFGSQ